MVKLKKLLLILFLLFGAVSLAREVWKERDYCYGGERTELRGVKFSKDGNFALRTYEYCYLGGKIYKNILVDVEIKVGNPDNRYVDNPVYDRYLVATSKSEYSFKAWKDEEIMVVIKGETNDFKNLKLAKKWFLNSKKKLF